MNTLLRIRLAVVATLALASLSLPASDRAYRRVLIAGNSITRHGPAPAIGWTNNWGMAASAPENDYLHLLQKGMEERSGVRPEVRIVGWQFLNNGTTDKAMVDRECAKALEWKPDLLITAQGEGALPVAESNELAKATYLQVVQNFRASGADVVLRAPFWKVEPYSRMLVSVAQATGAKFVETGDLSRDDANSAKGLFWHQGVAMHPGDRGMRLIADRLLEAVYPPAEKTDGLVSGWIRPTDVSTLVKLLDGDGKTVWSAGGCAWVFLHSYPSGGDGKPVLMRHFCFDMKARKDEWLHVAFAWRGDKVRFYIDGMPYNPAASFAEDVREVVGNRASQGVSLWTHETLAKGFRLKKGAWTAKEISDEYRAGCPVDLVMLDSYVPADDPSASAVWALAPGGAYTRPKPFEGWTDYTATLEVATEVQLVGKDGEPVGEVLASTPFAQYEVTRELQLRTPPKAWKPGLYRLLVRFRRPGAGEVRFRSLFFRAYAKTVTPAPSRDEWKLGETFFEKSYAGPSDVRFSAGETVASGNPALKYVEAGGVIGNRFADILPVPERYVGRPCCLELEWPDDRPREMGLYMYEMAENSCRDHLQGGLATGVEIPNTGTMQVRRHYYIPGGTNVMFEARTAAGERPAAVAKIRMIAIEGPLPVLRVRQPKGVRGRGFGHVDEDQTFENNLASHLMGGPVDMINPRLIEYFGYTGQNVMSYSVLRYMLDQSPLDHQTKVCFWPREQGALRGVIRELAEHGIRYFCQGWMDTPPTIGHADILDQELERRDVLLRNRDGSFVKNQFTTCGVFYGDPRSAEAREIIVRDCLPALRYAVESGCAAVSMNGANPFAFKSECMPADVESAAEAVTKSVGDFAAALRKSRRDLQFNLSLSGAEDEKAKCGLDAGRLAGDAKVSPLCTRNYTSYYWDLFTGKSMEGTDVLDRHYDPEAPNLKRLAAVSPGGSVPVVQSYNAYFETFNSPLGDDKRFKNYFQNSDVRPHGRWYLKDPAYCLAKADMLDYVHGSQPLASIGYESETREFCAAYCALPHLPFETMKGVDDPVVGRFLETEEGVYFYVVNYCHLPVTAALGAEVEALELSSERTARFSELALKPFELRSFLVPESAGFRPSAFALSLAAFDARAFDARFAEVGKATGAFDAKGLDCADAKAEVSRARAALAAGRLAATHYHLYHRSVNGLMEKFAKIDDILAVDGQRKAGRWLVNCGCNHYTRIGGLVFLPDREWDGRDYGWFGKRHRQWQRDLQYCAEGTRFREAYATEMFEIDGYKFRLPKGRYNVKLHVKWGYPHAWKPGLIAATYFVNGKLLDGFDFYEKQGHDIRNAVVLETTVDVDDVLTVTVEPGDAKSGLVTTDRDFALFNAIEITRER